MEHLKFKKRFKHNKSFIQYYRSNIFRPNVPSSGWQEWKIKYTVLSVSLDLNILRFYILYITE